MKREPKIYKAVILRRDRLVYDINFESWKIAQMRVDNKTMQMATSTDEEADMWLERQFNTCLDEIEGKLQFCLDHPTAAGDIKDNVLRGNRSFQAEEDEENAETAEVIATSGEAQERSDDSGSSEWPRQYVIGFRFSMFWRGNIGAIGSALHNYIKSFTLSEWFALTKPDEAARYAQAADDYLHKAINYCRQEDCSGITFRL